MSAPTAPVSPAKYVTTAASCTCPDQYYRGLRNPAHVCKHRQALAAATWPAEAWCCRCQRRYAWTEQSPLYCADCAPRLAVA